MNNSTANIFAGIDDLFSDLNLDDAQASIEKEQGVTAEPVAAPTTNISFSQPVANNQSLVISGQQKLNLIGAEIKSLFVERDELIQLMMLAITTGQSLLMLGMPGTAKSALTYEVCSRIENGKYFQWMLNKTSDPSELLGPYSIKAMEQDKFLRVTTGKLPEAHIAFIDECYKANAPVLNILLPIMNEKIFYNDGKPNDIPLITMIGASNEGPEDESLNAFHDRFLFRYKTKYVVDGGNKKIMYSNYIANRAGLFDLAQKTSITIDEVKALNEATKTIKVPMDIINKFIRFIADLDKQAIHISDRRQNECFKVMQGSAVLAGRSQVGLDDFRPLTYVLWEKEEQIPIIEAAILKMVNPFDDRFKELRESFAQIKYGIENTSDQGEKAKRSLEAKGTIEKLTSKVNKLLNDAAKNGKDVTDYTDFRNEMVAYGNKMIAAALGQSALASIGGDNEEENENGNKSFPF